MTPELVTPPTGDLVSLDLLKRQCRVDGADEDALLGAYLATAVAWLDGWGGLLGRAILSQTWAVDACSSGVVLLPMPDVVAARADYGDGEDPVALALRLGPAGVSVTVDAACRVSFDCAMPEPRLAVARQAVLILAAHWYANREAVGTSSLAELPFGARSLVQSLRWNRL